MGLERLAYNILLLLFETIKWKPLQKHKAFNKAEFLHTIHPARHSSVSKEIQIAYEVSLLVVRKEHAYHCSSKKLFWSIWGHSMEGASLIY